MKVYEIVVSAQKDLVTFRILAENEFRAISAVYELVRERVEPKVIQLVELS